MIAKFKQQRIKMNMRIVSLLVFLVSISTAYSADASEGSSSNVESKCYYGSIMNGDGEENIDEISCDFEGGWTCETGIHETGNLTSIFRSCITEMTCNRNAEENEFSCFSKEEGTRHCHFCCNSHLCNNVLDIPEK